MNKLLKVMIFVIIFLLLTGTGIAVGVYYLTQETDPGERSINEINRLSYETSELTTDLKDGKFVRVQFQLIKDGKKALRELEKREFQIKNTLIKELSVMNEDDFTTGIASVESQLKDELNDLMTDGEITDVYTITKILQ